MVTRHFSRCLGQSNDTFIPHPIATIYLKNFWFYNICFCRENIWTTSDLTLINNQSINHNYIMRSFYSKIPIWLVERLTRDFEMETSSVNEAQPFSHAYFQALFSKVMKTNKLHPITTVEHIKQSNRYSYKLLFSRNTIMIIKT